MLRLYLLDRLPISYPKGNTNICLMLAPWVQVWTSRESWPRGSILRTRKDGICVGIITFAYNSNGFSTFLDFLFLSRAGPTQRVTPAVTRLTVYRWLHISRRASSGYSKLEEKYQRRGQDPANWPEHLMDFSGFILDFLEICLYVCKFRLD